MALVHFDIKKNEFYTGSRDDFPKHFTTYWITIKNKVEDFIETVDTFHTSFGDTISFTLTDENKNTPKICVAPFEAATHPDNENVFIMKFAYVAMMPRTLVNSVRLFRDHLYRVCNKAKLQKMLDETSYHILVSKIMANQHTVTDYSYRDVYYTFAAVIEFTLRKLS